MAERPVTFCGSVGVHHQFSGGRCTSCGSNQSECRNATPDEQREAIARKVAEEVALARAQERDELAALREKAEALDAIERLSFDPRYALQGVQVHGLRSGEVNVSVRQGTNRTGESDPMLTEAVRALAARLEAEGKKTR